MAIIFEANHEAGPPLSNDWNAAAGPARNLTAAALEGTSFGLGYPDVTEEDESSGVRQIGMSPPASDEMRLKVRFSAKDVDTSGITGGASGDTFIWRCSLQVSTGGVLVEFELSYLGNKSLIVNAQRRWDPEGDSAFIPLVTDKVISPLDEHCIEVSMVQASSSVANDGRFTIAIDGIVQHRDTTSNLFETFDNFNELRVRGSTEFVGVQGLTGAAYLDEIVLLDDEKDVQCCGVDRVDHEGTLSVGVTYSPGDLNDTSGRLDIDDSTGLNGTNRALGITAIGLDSTFEAIKFTEPPCDDVMTFRCWIDPNSVAQVAGIDYELIRMGVFRDSNFEALAYLDLTVAQTGAPNAYLVRGTAVEDGGLEVKTAQFAITDAEHCLHFHLVRASAVSANDGTFEFFVDTVSQASLTAIDNFSRWRTWGTSLGSTGPTAVPAGMTGEMFLDELIRDLAIPSNFECGALSRIWFRDGAGALSNISDPAWGLPVEAVAVAPGTGYQEVWAAVGPQIFKTLNQGTSWTLFATLTFTPAAGILLHDASTAWYTKATGGNRVAIVDPLGVVTNLDTGHSTSGIGSSMKAAA